VLTGETRTGRPLLTIWMPKASKPFVNMQFTDAQKRLAYLGRVVDGYAQREAQKIQAREDAKGTPEQLAAVVVGTMFSYSWGYDQTNVDYFQLVGRSGRMAQLRPIAAETVRGSEGMMCEHVRPVKDAFIDDCKQCGGLKNGAQHQRSCGAFTHEYEPAPPIVKRLYFWNGEPAVSFSCGVGTPVKVLTFGNAEPLVLETDYRSHYH
jgi:hypothetical protein